MVLPCTKPSRNENKGTNERLVEFREKRAGKGAKEK